jgi:hypothetical protein
MKEVRHWMPWGENTITPQPENENRKPWEGKQETDITNGETKE